jgi:hypothetical protein
MKIHEMVQKLLQGGKHGLADTTSLYKVRKVVSKSITSDNFGGTFFMYSLKTAFSLSNLKIRNPLTIT